MRMTVNIPNHLMRDAMASTGITVKKKVIEEALRLLIGQYRRRRLGEKLGVTNLRLTTAELELLREDAPAPEADLGSSCDERGPR